MDVNPKMRDGKALFSSKTNLGITLFGVLQALEVGGLVNPGTAQATVDMLQWGLAMPVAAWGIRDWMGGFLNAMRSRK